MRLEDFKTRQPNPLWQLAIVVAFIVGLVLFVELWLAVGGVL